MDWTVWTGRMAGTMLLCAATGAGAATLTWDGDGPSDFWSAVNTVPGGSFGRTNWVGALLRPANGDDLVFAGSTRLSNRNDYTLLSVRNLSFAAGAGAFTLGGNGLLLQGNVSNASSQLQTLALGLTLTGSSSWDGGSGGLAVTGAVNIGDTQLALQHNVHVTAETGSWVVGDTGRGSLALAAGSTAALAGLSFAQASGSTGQLDLTGSGTRLRYTGPLDVGRGGTALVTLGGGAVLDGSAAAASFATLGRDAGSRGQVNLSGSGTQWQLNPYGATTGDRLTIGYGGEGRVLLEAGAQMLDGDLILGQVAGGHGVVTVSGASSQSRSVGTMVVGDGGTGELIVTNGGQAVWGRITAGSGGSGQVTATGPGSRLEAKIFDIGSTTDGLLQVVDGAQMVAEVVILGNNGPGPGGDWVLAGNGTQASVSNTLNIGLRTAGSLALRDGATLDSQRARLGFFDTGSGVAELRDGGVWRNAGELAVGVDGGAQLIVGDGGSLTTATLNIGTNGRVDLIGGALRSGSVAGTGRLSWRGGTLQIDQDAALATPLPASVALQPGMRLDVGRTLTVGTGATLTLAGGSLAAGTLLVDGGAIGAADGGTLDMNGIAMLRARGRIDAAVHGGASSIIETTGPLAMGDVSRAEGFLYDGAMLVGTQRVELNSAAMARLGVKTTLDQGGELVAAAGLLLPSGARLLAMGDAALDARLQLDGTLASSGGTLTLKRAVSGAGGFDGGSFAFLAGYDTGSAFADIDFGGANALFATQSTLTLKIGNGTDRLNNLALLDFRGTLRLVFDPSNSFIGGASLRLLDFAALAGGFDPARIVVEGFDAARVNTSLLGADGTLLISAVPAPPSAWTLLAGLLLLAGLRRARAGQGRARQP